MASNNLKYILNVANIPKKDYERAMEEYQNPFQQIDLQIGFFIRYEIPMEINVTLANQINNELEDNIMAAWTKSKSNFGLS